MQRPENGFSEWKNYLIETIKRHQALIDGIMSSMSELEKKQAVSETRQTVYTGIVVVVLTAGINWAWRHFGG